MPGRYIVLNGETAHGSGMMFSPTTRYRLFCVPVLLATVVACDNDPAEGKARATVAAAAASASPAPASAVTYAFSNDGSELTYVGAKVTRKHDGGFEAFRGKIQLVENEPTKGSVEVEIDTASITSDEEKLTGHLKSEDFFHVEKFPKAKFVSTAIVAGGPEGATHTVTGNLDLHGVTKSITFPAKIRPSGETVDADAEFAINRKDFEIVYPGMPDDLIKDDVLIKLKIRAKKL